MIKKSYAKCCFQTVLLPTSSSMMLLILRLIVGVAFILHGWGKIQQPMSWMPPDAPIPGFLQFLAAFSEFGGGIALVLGLLTRLAAFGLACTMAVAVGFHAFLMKDPFVSTSAGGSSYEPALVYFGISLLFLALGAGGLSLDSVFFGCKNSSDCKS